MGVSNFSGGNNDQDTNPPFPPMMMIGFGGGGNAPSQNQNSIEDIMVNLNKKPHTPTLFRENVILQTMSVLIGESKPNALLVGPAGTGKTKIAEELAHMIESKDVLVPSLLSGYTIWNLQLSDIIAGSGIVGEIEQKVNGIVEYASDVNNKAIIFIDEIHLLFSSESYKKISQILKPALSRGLIKVIGATTTQEFKNIETDPAFNRRFTKILVDELSKEQTVEILKTYDGVLKKHYGEPFNFSEELAWTIVNIADEFCSAGSHRPDNALTLFDRTIAESLINKQKMANSPDPQISAMIKSLKGLTLTENAIKRTAYKITTGNNEPKDFDEDKLRIAFAPIKGQDEIIEKLIKLIKLHDMHIRPSKKPLSILFAGSSGVGKTEVTKILAREYFEEKPIILNMTEYHSSASINKIIGAPAGYVGYSENSELPFDILDTNPYQVILLDEFEKCDKGVQRLFMSVLDEGYMKTNTGKVIDFSKSILIITTNAGCTINNAIGFKADDSKEKTVSELTDYFDVELINRFKYRFTFNSISRDTYKDIMKETYAEEVKQIKELKSSIKIDDEIDEDRLEELVEISYNKDLGARPVRTVIEDEIDTKIMGG